MKGKSRKFYVVWKGKRPGIYDSWASCREQISGVKGAQYMSFPNRAEAETAFRGNYMDYKGKAKKVATLSAAERLRIGEPDLHSIAVDAASGGNPGRMEYRGVDTKTRKALFHQGPFTRGTNNIGEFLAIVHGLAYLKERRSNRILYTDSRIAMSWVRKKKCQTKMVPHPDSEKLFTLIRRAEAWLAANDYDTPIVKWETRAWGEIPADFGRK